ncbi:MAG: ankyrin repeat domain-containing protein [Patescibacteria group bacterium]|nr:ankyrin repeat domain-containing protein [Patescibacteria group bacterium]
MTSIDSVNAHIGESISTPLTLATRCEDVKAVRQLIDRRADVNLPERGGKTALRLSCDCVLQEITELLIESGAKISEELDGILRYSWADPSREVVEKARKWQLSN